MDFKITDPDYIENMMKDNTYAEPFASITKEIYISRRKQINKAIFGEIRNIATENGLAECITLNESAIINAFHKQIPKKVICHGFDANKFISTVSYTCPVCKSHLSRTKYCPNCGQALEWHEWSDDE